MAMITMTWDLPQGNNYDNYIDDVYFTNDERTAWIPRMMKLPGAVELRAYRNPLRTTPQVLVLYEMDSLSSCLNFFESKEYAAFMDELRNDGCSHISVQFWSPSPLIPEPLKP